jgi:TetR/AcrR family transcriptional repressor of mexJK operon
MTLREAPSSTGKPAGTARLITEAARRCFLDVGYEACSMDAIARHADVSKATLYAHFASKEVLFVAVMQGEVDAHAERLAAFQVAGDADLAHQLVETGTAILSLMLEENSLRMFRMVIAEGARLPEPCRSALLARKMLVYQRVTEIFTRFDSEAPEEATRLFMAMIKGDLVWDCLLGARQPPQTAEIREHIDAVVQGMLRLCAERCPTASALTKNETKHA